MGHGRLVALVLVILIMASVVLKHQTPETSAPHKKYQK
jgi:hypothetical protein